MERNDMQINDAQLAQVNTQIQRLIAADNFYGRRLKEAGITGVNSVEDFYNLPFSENGSFSKSSCVLMSSGSIPLSRFA